MSLAEEIELAVATDRFNAWEERCEPDPDEGRKNEAIKSLNVALTHLEKAHDWMDQAANDVDGLPEASKIDEITEQCIGDLKTGIKQLQETLKYGR